MINTMTVEEKLRLICAKDFWHTVDFDGKIPYVTVADGPLGLRRANGECWEGHIPGISYPSMNVVGNSWNREISRKMGESIADDCLDVDVDILLGPGVNIKRSPLCGRNFEYFSEDPYLSGILGKEYIEGMQERGIGVCLKHFCANNLEYNRKEQTSDVDERTLREIYYKPFEIACEANPVSIMCSYNRINGTRGSEYKKGFEVLRKEFGFEGAIISDWESVYDRAKSAKAGLDLEIPYNQTNYERLVEDYRKGIISDEEIDVCAKRIWDMIQRCREMRQGKSAVLSFDERLSVTQEILEEGIVLLKNNGVLPLKNDASISACGLYARPHCNPDRKRDDLLVGGGSASVIRCTPMCDFISELEKQMKKTVAYEPAFQDNGIEPAYMSPGEAVANASLSDVNIVFAGTGAKIEYESVDRTTMKLMGDAAERTILETAAVNPNTVVVLFAGSVLDVSAWEDKVAAILYCGFPGEKGAEAVVNVLTGKVNPSGKLSETFPIRYEDSPASFTYIDSRVTRYQDGLDVGYRYYDKYGVKVQYPFGHGLSYSKFIYDNLHIEENNDSTFQVSFDIENISDIDGKEVSQVYVREVSPLVYRPLKELKNFSKDIIKAGEKKKITVTLQEKDFAYYSTAEDKWVVTNGIYEILIGASSSDIRLRKRIFIENKKK